MAQTGSLVAEALVDVRFGLPILEFEAFLETGGTAGSESGEEVSVVARAVTFGGGGLPDVVGAPPEPS